MSYSAMQYKCWRLRRNSSLSTAAGDIELNQNIELVNADQIICTLDKKKKFEMELTVKIGRIEFKTEGA